MNSGKVGGWRSKLTIQQGRFLSEIINSIDKFSYGIAFFLSEINCSIDKFTYSIAFHVKILTSSRTLHQMPS